MIFLRKIKWLPLILFVGITELVGSLSSLAAGDIKSVYMQLEKPPLSPPPEVFGIVWAILYALIGIAAYLVYNSEKSETRRNALAFWTVQLILNFLWPIVAFRFDWLFVAVILIVLIVLTTLITVLYFSKISKAAAYLMIPYLLWLVFATYLNIGFAVLN